MEDFLDDLDLALELLESLELLGEDGTLGHIDLEQIFNAVGEMES